MRDSARPGPYETLAPMGRTEDLIRRFSAGDLDLASFHSGVRAESGELANRALMLLTEYENSDLDEAALRRRASELLDG